MYRWCLSLCLHLVVSFPITTPLQCPVVHTVTTTCLHRILGCCGVGRTCHTAMLKLIHSATVLDDREDGSCLRSCQCAVDMYTVHAAKWNRTHQILLAVACPIVCTHSRTPDFQRSNDAPLRIRQRYKKDRLCIPKRMLI